jgi:hypothetical protein
VPAVNDSPAQQAAQPQKKHHPPSQRPHRPWMIGLAVLSAALVGVLAVIVLYHRSSREETYANLIYVWAMDDSWTGAKVIVTGDNIPPGGFEEELTQSNQLACRIHVPAGTYEVRVEKDGRTLARARSNPALSGSFASWTWWPFRAPPSATRPSLK